MTRDEAVRRIKRQLQFRTTLDSEIVEEMQTAQEMLEAAPTKPWFMISELAAEITAIGEPRVPTPINFVNEDDDSKLMYVPNDPDEDPIELVKDDYDTLRRTYLGRPRGRPEAYALHGEYFVLFPTPDAVYTLKQHFIEKQSVLETGTQENNWLKHVPYLLLGTTLLAIAESPLGNASATKVATQWITAGMRVLNIQNELRLHQNRIYQIGGKHY